MEQYTSSNYIRNRILINDLDYSIADRDLCRKFGFIPPSLIKLCLKPHQRDDPGKYLADSFLTSLMIANYFDRMRASSSSVFNMVNMNHFAKSYRKSEIVHSSSSRQNTQDQNQQLIDQDEEDPTASNLTEAESTVLREHMSNFDTNSTCSSSDNSNKDTSTSPILASNSPRPWTLEEDTILLDNQAKYGNKWLKISQMIPGRNKSECHVRYISIQKAAKREWTPNEDTILIDLILKSQCDFIKIKKQFPSRSMNALKTRWRDLNKINKSIAYTESTHKGSARQIFVSNKKALEIYFPSRLSSSSYHVDDNNNDDCCIDESNQSIESTGQTSLLLESYPISISSAPSKKLLPIKEQLLQNDDNEDDDNDVKHGFDKEKERKIVIEPIVVNGENQYESQSQNQDNNRISAEEQQDMLSTLFN